MKAIILAITSLFFMNTEMIAAEPTAKKQSASVAKKNVTPTAEVAAEKSATITAKSGTQLATSPTAKKEVGNTTKKKVTPTAKAGVEKSTTTTAKSKPKLGVSPTADVDLSSLAFDLQVDGVDGKKYAVGLVTSPDSAKALSGTAEAERKLRARYGVVSEKPLIITNRGMYNEYLRVKNGGVSGTAKNVTVSAKEAAQAVFGEFSLVPSFDVGMRYVVRSISASVPALGFKNEVKGSESMAWYLKYHMTSKIALEVEGNSSKLEQEISYYGSSFGSLEISSPLSWGVLYNPLGKRWFVQPYLGFGGRSPFDTSGGFGIGGFPFPTTTEGGGLWRIGTDLVLLNTKWVKLVGNVDYKSTSNKVRTVMPGIGSFDVIVNNEFGVGMSLRF